MPSSKASNFPGSSWVTAESYPELETTCGAGGEGFFLAAAEEEEETADPELLQAQLGSLRLWYSNTETLFPFEDKMEFWVRSNAGDVVEKGVRTNACDSFIVCEVMSVLYVWATKENGVVVRTENLGSATSRSVRERLRLSPNLSVTPGTHVQFTHHFVQP